MEHKFKKIGLITFTFSIIIMSSVIITQLLNSNNNYYNISENDQLGYIHTNNYFFEGYHEPFYAGSMIMFLSYVDKSNDIVGIPGTSDAFDYYPFYNNTYRIETEYEILNGYVDHIAGNIFYFKINEDLSNETLYDVTVGDTVESVRHIMGYETNLVISNIENIEQKLHIFYEPKYNSTLNNCNISKRTYVIPNYIANRSISWNNYNLFNLDSFTSKISVFNNTPSILNQTLIYPSMFSFININQTEAELYFLSLMTLYNLFNNNVEILLDNTTINVNFNTYEKSIQLDLNIIGIASGHGQYDLFDFSFNGSLILKINQEYKLSDFILEEELAFIYKKSLDGTYYEEVGSVTIKMNETEILDYEFPLKPFRPSTTIQWLGFIVLSIGSVFIFSLTNYLLKLKQ